MKVVVLGAGKMIEAIMLGFKGQVDLNHWHVYSPSGVSAAKLAKLTGATHLEDLDQVTPDLVLVGCKPQQLKDLKLTLGNRYSEAIFVSILAALSECDQRQILGISKLIRVMPNLPVKYRQGVSLISSDSGKGSLVQVKDLFARLGKALVVKESELEELTLLTGSGPAFFYEFTKYLSDSFSSLSPNEREALARQVLIGSGMSALQEVTDIPKMISAVTSKGGLTIAVLEKWRELKLSELVKEGLQAGRRRADELAAILRGL